MVFRYRCIYGSRTAPPKPRANAPVLSSGTTDSDAFVPEDHCVVGSPLELPLPSAPEAADSVPSHPRSSCALPASRTTGRFCCLFPYQRFTFGRDSSSTSFIMGGLHGILHFRAIASKIGDRFIFLPTNSQVAFVCFVGNHLCKICLVERVFDMELSIKVAACPVHIVSALPTNSLPSPARSRKVAVLIPPWRAAMTSSISSARSIRR